MTDAPPLPESYSDLPPDADWLDRNFLVAASGGYDWVLQDSYQHCSVTELEIMQVLTDNCSSQFKTSAGTFVGNSLGT